VCWQHCDKLDLLYISSLGDRRAINQADINYNFIKINGDYNIPPLLTKAAELVWATCVYSRCVKLSRFFSITCSRLRLIE